MPTTNIPCWIWIFFKRYKQNDGIKRHVRLVDVIDHCWISFDAIHGNRSKKESDTDWTSIGVF